MTKLSSPFKNKVNDHFPPLYNDILVD